MTQYIIRRLLLIPVILIGVTLLIFGMLSLLGPASAPRCMFVKFPKTNTSWIPLSNATDWMIPFWSSTIIGCRDQGP